MISFLQVLDFEKTRIYNLKVEAVNTYEDPRFHLMGPFKDVATVRIVVEDVDEPPVFTKSAYVLEVMEDARINTVIGTVTAQDLDAARSLVK